MIETIVTFATEAAWVIGVLFVGNVVIILGCLAMSAAEDGRWGDK